jgi:hypothetical protein
VGAGLLAMRAVGCIRRYRAKAIAGKPAPTKARPASR